MSDTPSKNRKRYLSLTAIFPESHFSVYSTFYQHDLEIQLRVGIHIVY